MSFINDLIDKLPNADVLSNCVAFPGKWSWNNLQQKTFQFIVGFVWINVILQIEVNFEQIGSIVIVPLGYIILSLLITFTITIMGTGW